MKRILSLCLFAALGASSVLAQSYSDIIENATGTTFGKSANSLVGFHGKRAKQRAGAAQAAITDSTTGTAGTTAAAGTGVQTITVPVNLATIAGAGDVLTAYTPGYKFKLLSISYAVKVPVTTGSKAATLSLKIGSTAVTGGAVALTSSNSTPLGAVVNGTSITAANTGANNATISVVATSVTAFAEGDGYLLLKVQNMDTADAHASSLALLNELRAAMVEKGEIKGAP